MHTIKEIASSFLEASIPVEKLKLRLQAQAILEGLDIKKSRSALLRRELGLKYFAGKDSSQKLVKCAKKGFITLGLYLSPSKTHGELFSLFPCAFPCAGNFACKDFFSNVASKFYDPAFYNTGNVYSIISGEFID